MKACRPQWTERLCLQTIVDKQGIIRLHVCLLCPEDYIYELCKNLLLHPTLLKTVTVYSVSKGGNCQILHACLLLCWYSKWHVARHSSVQLYVLKSCTWTHVHVQHQQKKYTVVDLSGHPLVSSVLWKSSIANPLKSFNTPKAACQELNNLPHTQLG